MSTVTDPAASEQVSYALGDFRTAVMRLARRMRSERPDDQLTPSQLAVLSTLLRDGPSTPAVLAASERVKPPSMTRILAALEQDGWITKGAHPGDRRQTIITATEQARQWLELKSQRRDHWLQESLEQLTAEEREALRAATPLLERLAAM